MKTKRLTNLLATSAIMATLVTLTSCRVEDIPGFESVFEDVTGSAPTSMTTYLASAAQTRGGSTEDFTEGFKSGYAAGYAEAAKLAAANHGDDHAHCDDADCDHHHHEQAEDIVWRKPTASPASNYGTDNTASYSTKPSSSESRSGYSRTRSSSRRNCAGGS